MKPTTDLDLAKAYQRLKDLLSRIEELTGKSPLSEPAGAKCGTCGSVNCLPSGICVLRAVSRSRFLIPEK